ncbi:MAG TPA: glutamate formimidoyltransferase [Bacteroidales bacterium]|nr:glutamate formimidoyltransferase [Bacteroidales bacterium]
MEASKIIECVPNFSEGRDMNIIKQITDAIESVDGVRLLDVDPGKDTNRTVVTFVGSPEQVCEAAFLAVKKASEVIDMSKHSGAHPRMGATDVCPLVPVSGITMEETVAYARGLAERIGRELSIPVYCYEEAAFSEKRKNLATVRSGEYEGLEKKLSDAEWKPDFGPALFNARTGAVIVGARDFLVAYNVNLNTTSTRRANAIAFDIRERGREVKDKDGKVTVIPGSLKAVKAIGWYIPEYGIAQISINLTNIGITPMHIAFDEVCKKANERGLRATGSELVGLVPLKAILDAGRYFLHKQQRSAGVSDEELIKIAVKSMGLDELRPFKPEEKIIEYLLRDTSEKRLVDMTLTDFVWETSSESPAPGGGSVSATMGALGSALGTMVANLSSHKRGWDDRWKEFSDIAEEGVIIQHRLLSLIDEDTNAFNLIMKAFELPRRTDEEKGRRTAAIEQATLVATKVPLDVMKESFKSYELLKKMVETGNPNSITDAGVGVLATTACIRGAGLNVRINAAGLKDKNAAGLLIDEANQIENKALKTEKEIIDIVNSKII